MAEPCPHMNFQVEADVHRLTKTENGPVTGYMADLRIRCVDCGRRFQFIGLPAGMNMSGATVSIDALEAHLAICPQGEDPSVLDKIAVHFAPERKH